MKKEEFQQNMKDRMQQFEDGGLRLLKKGQKGIEYQMCHNYLGAQFLSPLFNHRTEDRKSVV